VHSKKALSWLDYEPCSGDRLSAFSLPDKAASGGYENSDTLVVELANQSNLSPVDWRLKHTDCAVLFVYKTGMRTKGVDFHVEYPQLEEHAKK
jgi:hypothetical protein